MARKYIKINSVEDIDLSKIGLHNIENRYVDTAGNRYATRFNMHSRRVDIVRVALGNEEAHEARNVRVKLPTTTRKETGIETHAAAVRLPAWIGEMGLKPAEDIQVESYFQGVEKEVTRFMERLRGLMNNLKNSEVFDRKKGSGDMILDLGAIYDREFQPEMIQVQNAATEFTRFPKSMSYYLSQLERRQKIFVESLPEDQQLQYIRCINIATPYLKGLHGVIKFLKKIEDELPSAARERLPPDRQMYLNNAAESLKFIKDATLDEIRSALGWMKATRVI